MIKNKRVLKRFVKTRGVGGGTIKNHKTTASVVLLEHMKIMNTDIHPRHPLERCATQINY
jgi:hypothetical protein